MIDAKIQPVTRAETLALITTRGRMTRHDYMTATGLSRGSADQMFAVLQSLGQIEPCGREHGPDGKWWRTQFRAIGSKA